MFFMILSEFCLYQYMFHTLTRLIIGIHAAEKFPKITIAEEFEWKDCIQGSTAVVNLAGMPISTRWSSEVAIMY